MKSEFASNLAKRSISRLYGLFGPNWRTEAFTNETRQSVFPVRWQKSSYSNRCQIRFLLLILPILWVSACENEVSTPTSITSQSKVAKAAVKRNMVQEAKTPQFPHDLFSKKPDFMTHVTDAANYDPKGDEECCSDPGAIADCWWQDAHRDGATCLNDSQCDGGNCDLSIKMGNLSPPNGWGLCECNDDSDCNEGVCTEDGRCGPSFCNGFLVCSCWGGCQEANTGKYDNYDQMCQDTTEGYPGNCCEGKYPESTEGTTQGFCSNFCAGAGGTTCENDEDCNDGNPCTEDSCDDTNHCFYDPIEWGTPAIPNLCNPPINSKSANCIMEWCQAGKCIWRADHIGDLCTEGVLGIDETWYGGDTKDIRINTSDQSSCIFGTCDNKGQCQADVPRADGLFCDWDDGNPCTDSICDTGMCVPDDGEHHENEVCDGDSNACDLEQCFAGVCTFVTDTPCEDGNYCTEPDTCIPNPNHIDYTCDNVWLANGTNATENGYIDTDVCVDIICQNGTEKATPVVCTPPSDLHMTCNLYECDPTGIEDNCTVFPVNDGDPCDDNDGCTSDETCDTGACTHGTPKVCEDYNICTTDTCDHDPAGTCSFSPVVNGQPCDDNDKCTGDESLIPDNDSCQNGVCTAGDARDCSDVAYNDDCHIGVCDATTGGCFAEIQAGASCDDSDPCTVSDTCDASGDCVGTAKTCPDSVCNTGLCNASTGACELTPVADGTSCTATDGTGACTPNDTCQNGVCEPDVANLVTCTGDVCNTLYCDPIDGSCKYDNAANLNLNCDGVLDSDPCTLDQCVGSGPLVELTCTQVKENDISSWYGGAIVGTLTIDGDPGNASTLTDSVLGDAKGYLISEDTSGDADYYDGAATGTSGWGGYDHIWEIVYTGTDPATLHFSGCLYGGTGDFDAQMHLFDCAQTSIAEDNDSCASGNMPTFSVTLNPGETYFLLMDGYGTDESGTYTTAIYYDTCSDGILNGNEILVDSGGDVCCSNGIQNGNEEDIDQGGSCCSDGILNGDETDIDCGGAYCNPCDPCTNGVLDPGELAVDCGGICPAICTTDADCGAGNVCNTDIEPCGICLPLNCSGGTHDTHMELLGHFDQIELPMSEGCVDVFVGDQDELNYIHHNNRFLKFQMNAESSSSGGCDFTSPNYTYYYSTEYCATFQGISNIPYLDPSAATDFVRCTDWQTLTGSGRVSGQWHELLIPVMQYTRRVRIGLVDNGDNCVLNSNIYWQ